MPSVRRLVLTDLDRGTVHEFRDAEVRIGRDAACEISVSDAPASAGLADVHARIVPRATGWSLSDERTTAGTHVNHVRLVGSDQAILRTGDVIRLGTGAAARRFRVARIETLQRRATAPVRSPAAPPDDQRASNARIAASALGGAAAGTAALAARGGFNASVVSGAAAAGAVAGGAAIAVASRADSGTWRALGRAWSSRRIADSATASVWSGVAIGAVITAAAVGGYRTLRTADGSDAPARTAATATVPAARPAPPPRPTPSTTDPRPSGVPGATAGADDEQVRRLEETAARVGTLVAEVTAWYRGTPVRLTGIILTRGGDVASTTAAVRGPGGEPPDSVRVRWPDGVVRQAAPGDDADGVGLLRLRRWEGQWLADAGRGAPSFRPAWSAVVGVDRESAAPAILLSAAASVATVDGGIEVRGASERLLPGSALVDQDGRVVGLWLGGGRGVPLARALALLAGESGVARPAPRGD